MDRSGVVGFLFDFMGEPRGNVYSMFSIQEVLPKLSRWGGTDFWVHPAFVTFLTISAGAMVAVIPLVALLGLVLLWFLPLSSHGRFCGHMAVRHLMILQTLDLGFICFLCCAVFMKPFIKDMLLNQDQAFYYLNQQMMRDFPDVNLMDVDMYLLPGATYLAAAAVLLFSLSCLVLPAAQEAVRQDAFEAHGDSG